MTVSSLNTDVSYAGNDDTTEFPVTMQFLSSDELSVFLSVDGAAETELVAGVDYLIQDSTVVMTTAPATGDTLRIARTVAVLQQTSLSSDPFDPAVHEEMFDRCVEIDQQLAARLEVLESAGAVASGSYTSLLVTKQFTTPADPEAAFPLSLALGTGFVCASLEVVRIQNLTDPTAINYEAVFPHWQPATDAAQLNLLTGLAANTEYLVTFEARQ